MLAVHLGGSRMAMAGPFEGGEGYRHLIPADKKLQTAWLDSLFARHKEIFSGEALKTIGMPCGGIGTGQMYLCGDGTLGKWMVFNDAVGPFDPNQIYTWRTPEKPLEQGFGVNVDGRFTRLDQSGVPGVSFSGEYPVGRVQYPLDGLAIELQAFSPFIPLNAGDSSLPTTVFEFALRNTGDTQKQVELFGWLENGVGLESRKSIPLRGGSEFFSDADGLRGLVHRAALAPLRPEGERRESIIFIDFNTNDYGEWTVEGDAFGSQPCDGPVGEQQAFKGHEGGLANSCCGSEGEGTGRLISPAFVIERDFINFNLGGATWKPELCQIRLVVDGEIVRSQHGFGPQNLYPFNWNVRALAGQTAHIEIVDEVKGLAGHILADSIEFSDLPRRDPGGDWFQAKDRGELALCCFDASASGGALPEELASAFRDNKADYALEAREKGVVDSGAITLAPGETRRLRFALVWHFPYLRDKGNFYAERFEDSRAVVRYLATHLERLSAQTRLWRDLYYDSTLPPWFLDRVHSTASILATGTCEWWRDGRFYAFEGVLCCHGTCTHVWGYSQAHGRLFPEISKNIRERQDLMPIEQGGGFYPESGLVAFRGDRQYGFAADGQCDTILSAYRDYQMSPDDRYLRRNWQRIRKALEYMIVQDALGKAGGEDSPDSAALGSTISGAAREAAARPNGVLEGKQHNTYDLNYFGANTLVGALYLAALRAGEEMARDLGETDFATQCRELFLAGRRHNEERLWNGEYFIQDVDLAEHPDLQYKDGCLSDQLFGQCWAHQVGLGYLYDPAKVRKTLESIYKYNWAPDITPYVEKHPPGRWFSSPGQAGLFTCTWPQGNYMDNGTSYKNEIWTGIEYQVASHMIWEGLVEEGLSLCRAIHERYQPGIFNPYNEVECGDHYARAMASWGVYLAAAGFRYHGPRGLLGFAPKMMAEDFRAAFTLAEGWCVYEQQRKGDKLSASLSLPHGRLRLACLELELAEEATEIKTKAKLNGKTIAFEHAVRGKTVSLHFEREAFMQEGDRLEVTIKA